LSIGLPAVPGARFVRMADFGEDSAKQGVFLNCFSDLHPPRPGHLAFTSRRIV